MRVIFVITSPDAAPKAKIVKATCSLCAKKYSLSTDMNAREGHLCPRCGASGRSQAIAYFVSKYVFEKEVPLKKQKKRKTVKLIGLSDGQVYAKPLSKICDYTNSFYHQEPFLDITNPPEHYIGTFDGLISADVFEHILGEPGAAFRGAFQVLKPGGHLILTVPFVNVGDHQEHYPGLKSYTASQNQDGTYAAHLEFENGETRTDTNPCFHGGPGKTLEVRLFNRSRLMKELEDAGFEEITIHDDNLPEHGINWNPPSRPITARRPV